MQNSKQKVMILGAGQMQVPAIKKCKELDIYTIAVDFDENAPGFEYSDQPLILSTHDKDEILKQAKSNEIDGILTTSDYPVNSVAFVSEKLGLNSLSQGAAALSTNKFLLREKLRECKLNCPQYVVAGKNSELARVDFFPAIIKPVDSSASRGVKRVNTPEDLLEQFEMSKQFSVSENVIVEEFISGKEYSVESISQGGNHHIVAITEKTLIGQDDGLFVELAHQIPANLSEEETEQIHNETLAALNAIGLDNSASHTEIILSGRKAYIVEIGARLGGDFIGSDLVSLACGVDMLKNIVNVSIGKGISYKKRKNNYSGVHFITPANYNSAVAFIESTEDTIVQYEIGAYKNIKIENSLDRLGFIIVETESQAELSHIFSVINDDNQQN